MATNPQGRTTPPPTLKPLHPPKNPYQTPERQIINPLNSFGSQETTPPHRGGTTPPSPYWSGPVSPRGYMHASSASTIRRSYPSPSPPPPPPPPPSPEAERAPSPELYSLRSGPGSGSRPVLEAEAERPPLQDTLLNSPLTPTPRPPTTSKYTGWDDRSATCTLHHRLWRQRHSQTTTTTTTTTATAHAQKWEIGLGRSGHRIVKIRVRKRERGRGRGGCHGEETSPCALKRARLDVEEWTRGQREEWLRLQREEEKRERETWGFMFGTLDSEDGV